VPEIGTGAVQSINPFLLRNLPESSVKPKKNQKAGGAAKPAFSSLLKKNDGSVPALGTDDLSVEDAGLTALLDDVYSAGDALKNRPFPDEIQEYKRAVGRFVKFVVNNTFDIKNEKTRIRNKEISYTSVTVIDQKLEKLASEVMASQGEKLDILARVHEINGLLVDLLK
jgi:uncharacterized protein YaaR (DUF327 family)